MTLKSFNRLAFASVDDFVFGHSPNPVPLKNGLVIGGGEVYPEITLHYLP